MLQPIGKFTIILLSLASLAWGAELITTSAPLALTASGETYMAPKWSPDGSHIAVVGASYNGIYIIDFATKTIHTLTDESGTGYGFSWAPNGQTIAANVFRYDGPRRLSRTILLDLDGQQHKLNEEARQFQGYPHFSKSGDLIFLQAEHNIHTISLKQKAMAQPDNTVNSTQQELKDYQARMDQVNQVLSLVEDRIIDVEIAPSANQLAYTTIGENLWVVNLDGTNRRYLGKGTSPKWSPDSQWIACMITQDDGHVFTQSDILAYHVQSGHFSNLTPTETIFEMNPEWSPDGNWIAYENDLDGRIWALQVARR